MQRAHKRIFVGLSGGVDSSVAALRLLRAGHEVTGVFIKVWQPPFVECDWERERLDAMRVAAHLDIPFMTFDAEKIYKEAVAEYMVGEYKAGRTPNPDVMCNKHVKFGAFLEFARKKGADAVATGHYARRPAGETALLRGIDPEKDQSYFLWTLTPEELRHIHFPVGNSTKDAVRREAAKADLQTATKKDSQGICFLGSVDLEEFLAHFTTLTDGPVLDTKGKRIGTHRGALIYTTGQRHGFTVENATDRQVPHYVVAKDIEANTITVDTEPPTRMSGAIRIEAVNEIEPWESSTAYETQIRYRQRPFTTEVSELGNDHAILTLHEPTETPAPGQSCVLYKGERCIGGGIAALS